MDHMTHKPMRKLRKSLRQIARETTLFEFVGQHVGGWRHVKGDGYRELATIWWRIHR